MATVEEKQELVETLKGPRYYRIQITGYGGEGAYMSISKEAHDFWAPICEEYGDSDLVEYMISDNPDEGDYENIKNVPKEADFLTEKDSVDADYKCPWYESHTEFEHSYGATYGSAYLSVDEEDKDTNHIREVINREDIQELNDIIGEETEWDVELVEMGCCDDDPEGVEYIAQFYSSEKGSFFNGVIETIGEFDTKKLKIHTTEYLNGEDTITTLYYDGVEVDSDGGDTNGKGYSASVWSNM
jgi:hypothetical protein